MTRPTTSAALKRNKLVIGGVMALAVIVAVLSALVLGRAATLADEATSTPTPTPVVTPEPSAPASPADEPSETPVPSQPQAPAPSEAADPEPVAEPLGILAPGGVVRVTVESIKLRYTPSTEAIIVGTVERGELVEIAYTLVADGFGPVEADGFVWYPVSVLNMTELPELGTKRAYTGEILWMSVGNGTESWVERVAPRCPEGDPDLATLETMFDFETMECFGDRQITVEGVFGCGGCGGFLPGTFEPGWLATPMQYGFLSVDPSERIGPFKLHFVPDGWELPQASAIVRVTGHFNDARSSGCMIIPDHATHETDPVVEDAFCRKNFVVDSWEAIGVDEDFPFS